MVKLQAKKLLVTGGAGFLGSHLCDRLLAAGHDVLCVELAEAVVKMTGSKSKIVFAPLPSDDPRQRQPDIALARSKLGWGPTTELAEGLERTIRYFQQGL